MLDDPRAKNGACYNAYPMRVIVGPTEKKGKVFVSVVRADCNVTLMDYEFNSLERLERDINEVCNAACSASRGRDADD